MPHLPSLRRLLVPALAVLFVLLPAIAPARAATASSTSHHPRWVHVSGSVPPTLGKVKRLQRVATRRQFNVIVSLRLRNDAALQQFLTQAYDPSSPSYRHFLTPAQFAQRFAPSAGTRGEVTAWLKKQGLQVTNTSANGLEISVRGSAARIQAAFNTPIYSFKRGSQTFIANTQAVRVPGTFGSQILSVSGLSTEAQLQPVPGPKLQSTPQGYSPADIHNLYDFNSLYSSGINGTGQTLAIATYAGYDAANITTFDQRFNLPTGNVTKVAVKASGRTGAPLGVQNGEDESELDIEMSQATAPQAHILVYEAPPTDPGSLALFTRIVNDNKAQVISTSWGGAEIYWPASQINSMDQLFQEASAQGQAVFAPSGDNGAFDAAGTGPGTDTQLAVDFPASDPWVTSIGGTTLQTSGLVYGSESAWSDDSDPTLPTGTGGGLSTLFARPSYQAGPGVSNSDSNGMRQIPDVAADADTNTGYAIYAIGRSNQSHWGEYGGTSASTPLWAAFAALVNQSLGRRAGFLNPTIYQLAQKAATLPRQPFHDVTSGTNLYYSATPGWDYTTGWGSMDAAAFVADTKTITIPIVSTPAPTATAKPAKPTVSISKVVLVRSLSGRLQTTSSLKVSQSGTLFVLYKKAHDPSLMPKGKVTVTKNGTTIKTVTLKASTYNGKAALSAGLKFTNKQLAGKLVAHITVTLSSATARRNYTFNLSA
jgi:subtilase family serine protease